VGHGRSLAGIVGSNPAGGMDVCVQCCVLPGRGLCDGLITRPEKSCRLWCVMCDLETSRMRRPWPAFGRGATGGGGSQCRVVNITQNTLGGSVVCYEGELVVLWEIQLTVVLIWVELCLIFT